MEFLKFTETFLTASSLAMDALSVSICIGLAHTKLKRSEWLALGFAFGGFQFFMPLVGGFVAKGISGFFSVWTPWIAAALLIYVGANMIREAFCEKDEENCRMAVTFKNVIMLAFATSIDALIVGFSTESSGGSAMLLAIIAGVVTFGLSVAGALLGKELGKKFGKKAEIIGGTVLLAIAAIVIKDAL
ncbi:MAG: manganese efflux pump MntP family protein [Synergistes sp.]|nr:manganese efflux pump MntP family protein [Synergistes sp.]